jgi:putative ABC transport system substrate-binding protein
MLIKVKYQDNKTRIRYGNRACRLPLKAGYGLFRFNRIIPSAVFALALLCVSTFPASAVSAQIYVVKSGEEKIYQAVVDEFIHTWKQICSKKNLNQCESDIKNLTIQEGGDFPQTSRSDIIITIGSRAADRVMDLKTDARVLHALLPRDTYLKLHKSNNSPDHAVIFLDQPLERKLRLAQLVKPGKIRIGILLGPVSKSIKPELDKLTAGSNMVLNIEMIENSEQVGPKLGELFKHSDILVSIPDPVVFNRKTIRSVLLSSYHNRIPVIGYSKAYVKAGALAAVHSTPEDIGKNIAHFLSTLPGNPEVRKSIYEYPSFFSVSVNDDVAHSLGIQLQDSEGLKNSLQGGN